MTTPKSSAVFTPEKTFNTYTTEQGATYAKARPDYHPNLYKRIIDHHVSTGGRLNTLVDVGCGPGTATRILAPHFQTAIGLDPSEGMITAARELGGVSADGKPIRFECSSAEDLGRSTSTGCEKNGTSDTTTSVIPDGTADLITAATAAHWFDMSRFWARAAQLLPPGGTIALWTGRRMQVHPSVPNAAAMEAKMEEIMDRELKPFMEPGNIVAHELYANLPLPWTIEPNPAPELDRDSYVRKEWGTPGHEDAEAEGEEFYMGGQQEVGLDVFETALGTASPVTRWREANPQKVGTEEDVVRVMRREIERLLHEAGIPVGKEVVRGRVSGVLMMVKKRV